MRIRTSLLAFGLACALAAPALADNVPPELAAVQAACRDQGLTQGTQAFVQCVQAKLPGTSAGPTANGAVPPPPNPGNAPSAAVKAALDAAAVVCKNKGLVVNTAAFQDCLKIETMTGPALTPAQQAAFDYCKGKGIAQLTDAFKQCVANAGDAADATRLTGKQLDAYNGCKSLGVRTAAFGKCIEKALTTKIPDRGDAKDANAEIQAAMTACNAKKFPPTAQGQASFQACLKTALNKS